MSFLPAWDPSSTADTPPAPESEGLLAEVRVAANEIVECLERAAAATSQWQDERLSDALIDDAFARCLTRLAATGCWGAENRLPSSELWRIAGRILETGSLQNHARTKPHGYAGDHEMLTRICEQSCLGDPLGQAFDRYFLRQAAPAAVRSRTEQTGALLAAKCLRHAGDEFRVVSIGSGPALDMAGGVELLGKQRRRNVRVTLLDLAPAALDVARQRLEPLVSEDALTCERANLFRLPKIPTAPDLLGRPNLLICTGLFDYLDDDVAAAMLALFWQQLAPGGTLLVGNFAPHNPTRAYMEWIGNWYLTYRTVAELRAVAHRAEIPGERITIGSEQTGTDLFLIARAD